MGYRRFQIGCVFVEYDLFNTTTFIQNCMYINSRKNLTQFYINFSRQKHQIDVSNVSFNACDSQVSSVTPFHFSFKVPLSLNIVETYLDQSAMLFKLKTPNTFIPGWFRACSRVLNVHFLFVNGLSNTISMA